MDVHNNSSLTDTPRTTHSHRGGHASSGLSVYPSISILEETVQYFSIFSRTQTRLYNDTLEHTTFHFDECRIRIEQVKNTMSENPVVFFDITIGGSPKGRIEMELRADVVPKTAEVLIATFFFDMIWNYGNW